MKKNVIREFISKVWESKIVCILFHYRIKIKDYVYEIDPVTNRPYGRYKCKICGRRYIANNRFDWYQIDITKKNKGKRILKNNR